MHRKICHRALSAVSIFLTITSSALAITTYSDTPVAGTGTSFSSAPTLLENGVMTDGGWSYEVTNWGGGGAFTGTAISPQWFLTVSHVGSSSSVSYNGTDYGVVANSGVVINPDSSGGGIELWRVNGTFPSYAQVWNGVVDGSDNNVDAVVIGRGTSKGSEVYAQNNSNDPYQNGQLAGWQSGSSDKVLRWGQNQVFTGTVNGIPFLEYTFDAPGQGDNFSSGGNGGNEGALSSGDSGGGMFIYSTATHQWKLAGVNEAIIGTSTYSTLSDFSDASQGMFFDTLGLYTAVGQEVTYGSTRYVPDPSGHGYDQITSTGMTYGDYELSGQYTAISAAQLFLNTSSYTLAGSSPLVFKSNDSTTTLPVVTGSNTITAPVQFGASFTFTVPAGSTLTFSGTVTSASGVSLGSNGSGLLRMKDVRASSLTVTNGTLQVIPSGAASSVSIINSLSISSGGRLDLANNDLIVNWSGTNPTGTIRSYLVSSYD
ncbi:MAG TPA: hypothetical protein VG722_13605, partial [Tepidisphaeraceae bacterium]|nr:hypothetical protein [Tepidisphaeraceae bacterium]